MADVCINGMRVPSLTTFRLRAMCRKTAAEIKEADRVIVLGYLLRGKLTESSRCQTIKFRIVGITIQMRVEGDEMNLRRSLDLVECIAGFRVLQ